MPKEKKTPSSPQQLINPRSDEHPMFFCLDQKEWPWLRANNNRSAISCEYEETGHENKPRLHKQPLPYPFQAVCIPAKPATPSFACQKVAAINRNHWPPSLGISGRFGKDSYFWYNESMPRKIKELVRDLQCAGFYEISGGGKGSHRKFTHAIYAGAVTLTGKPGDDAKPYQEKQVKQAVEAVKN